MDWTAMVAVGRVVRPQGNRGEVVVAPETDFADARFRPGAALYLMRNGRVSALTVRSSRPHAGRWVVGFEGVASIDDADGLRDAELRIAAEAVQPLGPGAFYVYDLVGCEVRTIEGVRIGRVSRVDLATGVPMLVVGDADEVLVPFAEAICRRVDPAARTIEIDPPEGLVDLNRPAQRR